MNVSRSKLGKLNRNGVECVEAAVTLPLMLMVFFATVQLTHHWHIEKLLKIASYEAMKVGAASGGTQADAVAIFNQHTESLGIVGASLEFSGPSFESADVGELLGCVATAPVESNEYPSPISLGLPDTMAGGWVYARKEGL